jgi:hypothetical protein
MQTFADAKHLATDKSIPAAKSPDNSTNITHVV